jgi:exopolysaccharide biosynthesis polyprenyl glycosylphosphotransferase
VVGRLEHLPRLVRLHHVDRVLVGYTHAADSELVRILRRVEPGVSIQVVPRLFEIVQARGFELGRLSMLEAGGTVPSPSEQAVKRALDVLVATAILLVSLPLLCAVAAAVKFESHGPLIYRSERVGRFGRRFAMLKFRSMTTDAEAASHEIIRDLPIHEAVKTLKVQSAQRHVTRVGRFIRRTSLDELPQLWNVLRGDMGLVGPRPMPPYEAEGLEPWEASVRHAIRPGITGLWQVSGRSSLSWRQRIQLDCSYARHWSVTTDIRILFRTFAVVVLHRDAL